VTIKNYNQALAFANSRQGKAIPGMANVIDELTYEVKRNPGRKGEARRQKTVQQLISKINQAKEDPTSFVKSSLNTQIKNYLRAYIYAGKGSDRFFGTPATWKKEVNTSVNFLIQNKVPATEIQNIFTNAEGQQKALIEESIRLQSQQGFFDKLFNVADNLIVGGLTSGLGLSPINAMALNSAIAIANGASVEDALKAGLAGLGANQVGQYLQTVNSITANPIVNSALTNAAQSASAAAVLGQDIKTAALAGLAGGAVAGTLYKASDNAAISKAAGEYTQAIAAGQSPQMAMIAALSGFADTEMDEAKRKIETEADAINQTRKADAESKARQDQVVETFDQPKSPGVGTQIGDPTAELSGGVQFGSRAGAEGTDIVRDVDLPSISVKPYVPSDSDTLPTVEVTGTKPSVQDVATESAFLDELKKAAISGDTQSLIDVTQNVKLPSDLEGQKVAEPLKTENKEFNESLLKLPEQDLRDLNALLSTGAGKDLPSYSDVLVNADKNLGAAEVNKSEVLDKVAVSPSPDVDLLKADLSSYNKYPDATSKFIDQGEVVYVKGAGTLDSPVEVLGTEPYVTSQVKSPSTDPAEVLANSITTPDSPDLADLQDLSKVPKPPASTNLLLKLNLSKAAANDALVALQSANTPETIQAARDALADYELSQKMYTQATGEELSALPDEKPATQEFPLVDEAVKTGQMIGLSNAVPVGALTPAQRYQQYRRLSGQKDDEKDAMGDTGLGIAVLPRFEGMMEPQMFARGGLTALRRI
jgi:hypothetical protein